MENYAQLISDVHSLNERREQQRQPLKEIAESQYWKARMNALIDVIQRDRLVATGEACSRDLAIAYALDYWAVSENIDTGHENPLLDPAEYGHEVEQQPGRLQRAWGWLNSEI